MIIALLDEPYGGVAVEEEEKEKISRGNSQHSVAYFPAPRSSCIYLKARELPHSRKRRPRPVPLASTRSIVNGGARLSHAGHHAGQWHHGLGAVMLTL